MSISDPKADRLRDLRDGWNRSRCVNARSVPRSVYLEPGTSGFCGSVRQYIKHPLARRPPCTTSPQRHERCRLRGQATARDARCTSPDAVANSHADWARCRQSPARSHCSQLALCYPVFLELLSGSVLRSSPRRNTRCLRPPPPDHRLQLLGICGLPLLWKPHLFASWTFYTPAPYAPSSAPLYLATADYHDSSRSQSHLHPRPC